MTIRLCKDCRHYKASSLTQGPLNNLDKCVNPAVVKVDYVRGEDVPAFASLTRMLDVGKCGPTAELWEPHPEEFLSSEEEASDVEF